MIINVANLDTRLAEAIENGTIGTGEFPELLQTKLDEALVDIDDNSIIWFSEGNYKLDHITTDRRITITGDENTSIDGVSITAKALKVSQVSLTNFNIDVTNTIAIYLSTSIATGTINCTDFEYNGSAIIGVTVETGKANISTSTISGCIFNKFTIINSTYIEWSYFYGGGSVTFSVMESSTANECFLNGKLLNDVYITNSNIDCVSISDCTIISLHNLSVKELSNTTVTIDASLSNLDIGYIENSDITITDSVINLVLVGWTGETNEINLKGDTNGSIQSPDTIIEILNIFDTVRVFLNYKHILIFDDTIDMDNFLLPIEEVDLPNNFDLNSANELRKRYNLVTDNTYTNVPTAIGESVLNILPCKDGFVQELLDLTTYLKYYRRYNNSSGYESMWTNA